MYPETYAEALREGFESGQAREHARIRGHLDRGEACGAIPFAVRQIFERTPVADCEPDYLAARMSWKKQPANENGPSTIDAN